MIPVQTVTKAPVRSLAELDRAAKSHPNATSDHVTKLVIAGRRAHPTWGPRKDASNAVWAADFKGHFKLTNGKKCYPLTISDGFSRFLLRCEARAHPNGEATFKTFEAAFHEYGLL